MANRKNALIRFCLSAAVYLIFDPEEDDDYIEEFRMPRRKIWIKEWRKNRTQKGSFDFLTKELKNNDGDSYKNYLRMNESCFQEILSYIKDDIKKQDTILRDAIPVGEKLAVTLRFLATGESFKSLEYQTRLSDSFISNTVIEVCEAIYKNMQPSFLKFPESKADWKRIAEGFTLRWQFPLCLGALDGKHVKFTASKKDGSTYYNYKGFNSIVLLALSDAYYKFTFVDVGCNGRISDGGVLNRSKFMEVIRNSSKFFPEDATIGNNRVLPYVVIGDDAFPLQEHIMKPYPFNTKDLAQEMFNYRLSRARQTSEHSFAMLGNRFGIFKTSINLSAAKVKTIVKACCVLHNYLTERSDWYHSATPPSIQNLTEHPIPSPSNRSSDRARTVRNTFADYFCNEGKVPWQESGNK